MTSVHRLRAHPVLEVSRLSSGWGRRSVLREVSFSIERGDRVAILGPNGAGKSTLFDSLMGRLCPTSGRVSLDGVDITGHPLHRLARRGLAYVPQDPTVFPELSVEGNLRAALRSPARRGAVRRGELDESLEHWNLKSLRERPAALLSGGERRRVEVARALLLCPRVLLLDEPFAGLDPGGRKALLEGLRESGKKTTVVLSDHAAEDALSFSDRVVLLVDGAVAFDGPTQSFSPQLSSWNRYFGRESALRSPN